MGFVTVTDAHITGDLREATVYISLLAAMKIKEYPCCLKSANGFIRTEVGRRLGIRYSPTIEFKEDTSLDYGMKIDKILRDIETDKES